MQIAVRVVLHLNLAVRIPNALWTFLAIIFFLLSIIPYTSIIKRLNRPWSYNHNVLFFSCFSFLMNEFIAEWTEVVTTEKGLFLLTSTWIVTYNVYIIVTPGGRYCYIPLTCCNYWGGGAVVVFAHVFCLLFNCRIDWLSLLKKNHISALISWHRGLFA